MRTKRLRERDYWVYPSPIQPGEWRVCKTRPYNRFVQVKHIKPNRLAWHIRQTYLSLERYDTWLDNQHDYDLLECPVGLGCKIPWCRCL